MSGRNSKPDNDGPASSPSRLDQFGDKLAEDTVSREAAKASDTAKKNKR
ncbi:MULTISPECIES: hypothetical protein [unclassified Paenibacillus]|nr:MULTISPECIES: hypothetical protein [unclassified Paenibacillus]MBP1156908.1 hypothetical protein [Paenibacillus sp. PvP091]MBP1172353.1 hypothetical protein [Paenibacillus sp. PvR098]MBP2438734.1 hypothetical protein [Paenibacillus sp. PvP052]